MSTITKVLRVVGEDEAVGATPVEETVRLVGADGSDVDLAPSEPYQLPAAASAAIGGVRLAAVTPLVKAADVPAATGEAPAKAEFDALAALANENKAAINSIINAARAAGQAASK